MSLPQALAPLAAGLAAALVATDRRIVRTLLRADATTAARAVPVPRRTPLTALRLRRLASVGAVNQVGGAYYLDPDGWRRADGAPRVGGGR